MLKNLLLFCFLLTIATAVGHKKTSKKGTETETLSEKESSQLLESYQKVQSDADLQAELMPQELNPAFASEGMDEPWRAFVPLGTRSRRSSDMIEPILTPVVSLAEKVKGYSRVVAALVIFVSAIIELVVYVIEAY